jgi:hypothetical protein
VPDVAASQAERLDPPVIGGADVAGLVDLIADHLADRLAPRIAELIAMGTADASNDDATDLWSARRVATHYDVGVAFVYQHADELGCIRLGGGRRPRLRFDPRIVRERWHRVGEMPATARTRRRPSRRTAGAGRGTYQLLAYDREP